MQFMEMVRDYFTGSSHGSGRGGPRHHPEVHGGMQQGITLVLLSPPTIHRLEEMKCF